MADKQWSLEDTIPESHRIYDATTGVFTLYSANVMPAPNETVISHYDDKSLAQGRFAFTSALSDKVQPALIWHPQSPNQSEQDFLPLPLSRRYEALRARSGPLAQSLQLLNKLNAGLWPILPIYAPSNRPRYGPEEATEVVKWRYYESSPPGGALFVIEGQYVVSPIQSLERSFGLLSFDKDVGGGPGRVCWRLWSNTELGHIAMAGRVTEIGNGGISEIGLVRRVVDIFGASETGQGVQTQIAERIAKMITTDDFGVFVRSRDLEKTLGPKLEWKSAMDDF